MVAGHAMADHAQSAGIVCNHAANLAASASTQINRQQKDQRGGGLLRDLQDGSGAQGDGGRLCVDLFDARQPVK